MVSDTFPAAGAALATTLTRGLRDIRLDKTGLFAPDAIKQINHSVGRHRCARVGRLVPPADYAMQLRHYKNLGADYLVGRTHALAGRLNGDDLARGWSAHYLRDDAAIRTHFQQQLTQSEPAPSPSPTGQAEDRRRSHGGVG